MSSNQSGGNGTFRVETRDFGEIEAERDHILTFPQGLFAFEDQREFVLISPLGEDAFPMWLQSVQGKSPCFIVFDPTALVPDYIPVLSQEAKGILKAGEGEALQWLAIAVVPEDCRDTAINLKSPIAVNRNKKLAAQVIQEGDLPLRFPIYPKGEDAPCL